jgi:hypothetical protein
MAGGDSGAEAGQELSGFQLEVARLFFGLPESRGFLLAGGAALLAQYLTTRPTDDLDFSPLPSEAMSLPRVTPWSPRSGGGAGEQSGFMTATRSAGWLSRTVRRGSWSISP